MTDMHNVHKLELKSMLVFSRHSDKRSIYRYTLVWDRSLFIGEGGSMEDFVGDHMVFMGNGGDQLSPIEYKWETKEN